MSSRSSIGLTAAQRMSLKWLGLVGDSQHMSRYASRGLASLERRGLAVNVGGRGRSKSLVLTDDGKRALVAIEAQPELGEAN